MAGQPFRRAVAYKVSVGTVLQSRFIRREGWDPSFLEGPEGMEISRVNVLGAITQTLETAQGVPYLVLADHTGSIELRDFSEEQKFKGVAVGDMVSVIGRPRLFNEQRYLQVEIIKRLDDPR